MARPRKFDEEWAVGAAMRAFWAEGYEATSTQDLCEATGLGRSSIYNTFKSKRDLFGQALRRYVEEMTGRQVEILEGPLPVREKIRTILVQVVDDECGERRGCLVVNASLELGHRDQDVAATLKSDYDRQVEAIRAAIESGKLDGDIPPDRDALALAHFVHATAGGLRIAARGGADRPALEAVVTTALSAF
ncbi:TetR/AcrR family transcriptional regulator [Sphaerisporangium corydalis]|uniref:TetR/AcrR family transcriptional regulator n=1 Tax=Sphaerisporangium corydalis TaxID=1441875 RepID=A0ABV9EJV8_9ACTN|nr:TetR/AcrR family transcriptional regulator [Sphaerisporangium corydalis]